MAENIYIKFAEKPVSPEAKRKNNIASTIFSIIFFFIPKANPDLEDRIDRVTEWQLEIDPIDNLPIREIGKGSNNKIVLIMPWRDNCGYWTDNTGMKLEDFISHYKAINMDKTEFEKNWESFMRVNPE